MSDTERRYTPAPSDVRATGAASGTKRGIRGLGAVYDTPTTIAGQFDEVIRPGAFADVLSADVRGLFNHSPNHVLGRTSAGTMHLRSTSRGLEYEIAELPRSREDVLEAVQRRDVTGSSFSFAVEPEGERWTDTKHRSDGRKLPLREIVRVASLYDVGPVAYPAYPEAEVSERASKMARMSPAQLWAANERRRLDEAERAGRNVVSAALSRRLAAEAVSAEFELRQLDRHIEAARRRAARTENRSLLRAVAYHEAGHAVMAWATGGSPTEARIKHTVSGRVTGAGSVKTETVWRSPEMAMAGAVAESLSGAVPDCPSTSASDRRQAAARGADTDAKQRAARDVAEAVLLDHWPAVEAVAKRLQERIVLGQAELEEIIWNATTDRERDAASSLMRLGLRHQV